MLFWYQILKILLFDMRNERVSVVVGIVGKSKSLDFSTNPNLGEIQTFYGKADKFSFCRIKSLDFILYIFQIYYHRMQEVIS